MQSQTIEFPKDEGKHDSMTEWWYLNGHLRSKDGQEFAYMSTLFRVKYPAILGGPFHLLPSRDAYFYHSVITDVTEKSHRPNVEIVSVSKDSFPREKLIASFKGLHSDNQYKLKQTSNGEYITKGPDFDLSLDSEKNPLLVGETGYVDNVGSQTYYYSLSSLKTKGFLTHNTKNISVTGKSWMDHQWGDFGIPKGYWDWFSIQLENDTEIVCYRSGSKKGKKALATISFANGEQKSYSKIRFKVGENYWTSPKTKARYPLSWEIEIHGANILLNIEALVPDHEVNFWYINYWEGPSKVTASIGGKSVSGQGFIELVGRRSKIRRFGPLTTFFLGQIERYKYS